MYGFSERKLAEHLYTKDYKPFFYCEDIDKENMHEYLEYKEIVEPDTLKNMYNKEKSGFSMIANELLFFHDAYIIKYIKYILLYQKII